MKQTVVGVFDRYAQAQHAAQQLRESGFGDSVFVTEQLDDQAASTSAAQPKEEEGVFAHVRNFFADLFGADDDREVGPYADAVRRGGGVVKVEVDEEAKADAARVALLQAGAVDFDESASQWRSSQGRDTTGESDTLSPDMPSTTAKGSKKKVRASADRTGATSDEDVIPVMREEVRVGKQTLSTGGVRVYARTVETPVREQVDLRSERAVVERQPVDRPASSDEINAIGERTIEVRETTEQPVVAKEARVVEEVRVGKKVDVQTQEIRDSVRSTQVDVEPMAAEGAAAGSSNAPDFQTHFRTNFASEGGRYEEYEPAYLYGQSMHGNSRYAKREWEDVEPDLQRDWETRNPGSSWERFKAAVRHGWNRMTA